MTTTVPAGSIVVALDGSLRSAAAMAWGLTQASLEGRAVDVVHLLGATTRAERAGCHLDDLVAVARHERPDLTVRTHVARREARRGLLDLSVSAHLLVLGSRGGDPHLDPLTGSVGAAVTRRAACPTVVVRPPTARAAWEPASGAGVLVGVDGTAESRPVVEHAFAQASLRRHDLTAVHCGRPAPPACADGTFPTGTGWDTARTALEHVVADLAAKYPDVRVTRRLGHGPLDQVVDEPFHRWDLVVVGGRRRGAWHRTLVGRTTTSVLERARCPVAVVPEAPAEDGAPVR